METLVELVVGFLLLWPLATVVLMSQIPYGGERGYTRFCAGLAAIITAIAGAMWYWNNRA